MLIVDRADRRDLSVRFYSQNPRGKWKRSQKSELFDRSKIGGRYISKSEAGIRRATVEWAASCRQCGVDR